VVLQGSEAECAAACLAMVATYHGHHLTLRESREICAVGRDGASAAALARAARSTGLTVEARRPAPGVLREVPLPAIAHWGSDHFVVVERASRDRVRIVDAGRGRRSMPAAEFEASVGRVLLTAQPGQDFRRRPATTAPFWRRYAAALLRMPGTRLPLAQLLGVGVVVQLLGLAVPIVVLTVIDKVIPSRASSVLPLLGVGLVIVVAAQLLTGYLRGSLIIYLQGRLDTQAMISFCAHLMRLPLDYFQRRRTGDIMLRAWSIAGLRELLTAQTLSALLDLMMIVVYLAVMAAADLPIALVVFAVVAAQVGLLAVTLPLARDRTSAELATQAEAYGQLAETIEGITTVKAAAAEQRALDRWSLLFLPWMRATLRRAQVSAAAEAVSGALRTLAPLAVLWLAAAGVLDGGLSVGAAMALTWLASAIIVPLSVLAVGGQRMQMAGAQMQRLADVLDAPAESPPGGTFAYGGTAAARVELRGVSFRYDPCSPLALRDLSAAIEPGSKVAIVGASGAGKTTLGLLILGLHRPSGGSIWVDGTDLATVDPAAVRARIGTVLQDPFVFSGTIGSNITFDDPAITPADIERAARLACLHPDVMALPQGYQTRLGERGGGLSGGQRQRLAIARAIVHQPAMLLLDEATSHLDAMTEAAIHRNLATLDCTQIVIAHRLSTVRDADVILVLDGGQLAESGSHAELLARDGRYASLVGAQLGDRGAVAEQGVVAQRGEAARHGNGGGAVPVGAALPAASGSGDIPGRR
jgi:ABC-type bacteriocin/lantibiotic exporter with double-glycine peptidase domain